MSRMIVSDSDITGRRRAHLAAERKTLQRQVSDLQRLHEATMRVARLRDWPLAARELLQAALVATGAPKGLLSVRHGAENGLRVAASIGFTPGFLTTIGFVPSGSGACGVAFERRQRVVVTEMESDPILERYREALRAEGVEACHTVPLLAGAEMVGTLSVYYEMRHQPDEREVRLLDLYGQIGASFLERLRAVEMARSLERDARLLASIVEASNDAIISKDLAGIITSWNQSAERLFGYRADEAVGQSITLLIPPDRPDEEKGILERIRAGERIEHFETVRVRKDGSRVHLSLSISPIRDAGGTIIGASKIARDITERRWADLELRRQEKLYRAIGESMDYGIWVCDAAGRRIYTSESFLQLVGRTAAEISAQPWAMLDGPVAAAAERAWDECVRTGAAWEQELQVRGRDGECYSVLSRGGPIRDDDGRVAYWAGINLDVSEFRRSERQLRLVTDNAMVYLARCGRDGRFRFVNRPYAELYGRRPADLIGRSVAAVVGTEAYALLQPRLDAALAGHRVDFEFERDVGEAGPRWLRVIYEPERTADGGIVGIVAVLTDITARKQAEREMELTRDQALAASRAKDEFLAALSHELRTPLNPVLLLASEAVEDPAMPPRVRAAFEVVRKNVELEARLIDDLLDLTRITRGKLPLTFAGVRLARILSDAIETIRPEIQQKQLDLRIDAGRDDALVWGDAVRLQQVLWNVVKNAVKFTPEGGRIDVRVKTDLTRGRVAVEVADSGIGMTETELSRVFDAFAQGEHAAGGGSHRFGGLGLGLAISKMLTELHQGSIRALSAGRDLGSQFVIELPLCASAAPAVERAGPGAPVAEDRVVIAPTIPAPVTCRILLVEDHEPTRAALAQLLARRRHEVTVSATTAEARSLAARNDFDLIVSDVGLPDGNGHELMAELQRLRPGLVGIALTGYGMDHDVVRSELAGFAVHLTKPVTVQALDAALARALQRVAGRRGR